MNGTNGFASPSRIQPSSHSRSKRASPSSVRHSVSSSSYSDGSSSPIARASRRNVSVVERHSPGGSTAGRFSDTYMCP